MPAGRPQLLAFRDAMPLARAIGRPLGAGVEEMHTHTFDNGQMEVPAPHHLAPGDDVVLIQVFPDDVHRRLFEVLLSLSLLRGLTTRRLTVVLPHMPYARSDKALTPGGELPFRRVADMIVRAGADRIITVALHAPHLAGLFDAPLFDLDPTPALVARLPRSRAGYVVVSPDLGGAKRASRIAEALGSPLAVMRKQRTAAGKQAFDMLGALGDRDLLLVDDEVNSGETLASAIALAAPRGRRVLALAIHDQLTEAGADRLEAAGLERLIVTDSTGRARPQPWLETVSVASMIAEAIRPAAHPGNR